MMPDPGSIAQAAVALLSPFMPYLIPLGKSLGKKLEDVISEQGGEVVWEQAQKLWDKITGRLKDDPVVQAQATMVADAPASTAAQQLLTQKLSERLATNPDLLQEFLDIIGGPEGVQRVIAAKNAEVTDFDQNMAQAGIQEVTAGEGAKVRRFTQNQGFNAPVVRPAPLAGRDRLEE